MNVQTDGGIVKVLGAGAGAVGPPAGKFDKLASMFSGRLAAQGRHPLYTGGRLYLYAGTHYRDCGELPMLVREFMRSNGMGQSNNIVGNAVPIVMAGAWRDDAECGPLPFWGGAGPLPFSDIKNVVAFKNGLLDLGRPGQPLVPHTPDWCSTVSLPFEYYPSAECPHWQRFLGEVTDGGGAKMLQEWFGYCLTLDTTLHKMLVLIGKTRSGKTTTLEVLSALAGEENSTVYSLYQLVSDFGLAPLVGRTLATVGEVELDRADKNKIVETLKSIVGGDAVLVNAKHEKCEASN